jgi:PAS domain S-box-containing protein
VFLEGGLALILYQNDYLFANLIPPEISPIYSFGFYLTGLLGSLLFAFLYEKERDDARTREEEKSRMLMDSARYIERILERLPVATFVLDNSHRVVQWNRACHELTGVSSQEIIGKRVWEGFSLDEDGSMADKLLANPDVLHEKYSDSIVSMTDSGSFSVDTMLPNLKGGMHAVVRAAPILDQDGGVQGAIQTIQEISEHEENSASGPGSVDGSIEDAAYPVFKVDSKGKICGWNRSCEDSLGYPSSQMLGKDALSFVSKTYRNKFRAAIVQVFKGESFGNMEWKYYTAKEEPIYVLARGFPAYEPSGNIQECIIINTDITDIKLRMKKLGRGALEIKEKFKKLVEEHNLLKKNIASFIRKREE